MASLEQEVGNLLRRKTLTLGLVESATGGLISHLITNIPGSSHYYKGSVTAYSNEVKVKVVGVREETINRYGAVSCQVAEEMTEGGQESFSGRHMFSRYWNCWAGWCYSGKASGAILPWFISSDWDL